MFENKNIVKQQLLAEMHAPRASKENISDSEKTQNQGEKQF